LHNLWEACRGGKIDAVNEFIESGKIDINIGGGLEKKNALHYAVDAGHLDIVKLILEKGKANVNALTQENRSALHMAAGNDYDDIVFYLLSYPIEANHKIRDKSGKLAFHCCHCGRVREIFRDQKKGPLPMGYKGYF